MKGFIFTLDAVFALVVAAVGVSILLYVDFTNPGSYASASTQAASIMQGMLQTTVGSAASGSLYLSYLTTSSGASAFVWPQFAHDAALSSSTNYSLQAPVLLYTFNAPNVIIPSVSVNSGFAAFASGNKVYLINASTGKSKAVVPVGTTTNAVDAPAIYRNMLMFANATNVVRAFNVYNTVLQWNFSAGNSITTPIEIENNYVAFSTTNGFYLLNLINGSRVAYANVQAPTQVPIYVNGEYIVSTDFLSSQNYLYSYSLVGNSLISTWNALLTATPTTQPSSSNNSVAVGSGNFVYIFSLGGTLLFQSTDLGSGVLGIASYKGNYYVQAAKKLYGFSSTGNSIFGFSTVTDLQNSTPTVGPAAFYTLINGNLFQAYNTSMNKMIWNMSLPSNYLNPGYSNIALAYGNIYVPNGNKLYVFGTYKAQASDNILQTLANMYLNNQSDYSTIVLQSLYNSSTTGIFINNTYAPTLSVASFNAPANSYVEQADGFAWMDNTTNRFTMSVWINPLSGNGVIVDELGQVTPNTNWHGSMLELSNGIVYARVLNQPCIRLGPIKLNSWSNIVMTWNGLIYTGYINGVSANSMSGSRNIPGGGALMYYPLGVSDPTTNCGSGAAFSGSMLNFQIYNITLSKGQVSQLYQSGAFGQPVSTSRVTIWLPLDGNSNDFSGAFDIGIPYNMKYNLNKYTPQRLSNAYQISKSSVPLYLTSNGVIKQYNVSVVTWR